MEEGRYHVAQANVALDNRGRFTDDLVVCRHSGDVLMITPDKVDYMDGVAEATGFGRGGADSVPRERRRQPRADGFEHAASGRAAGARRGAFVGTGMEGVVARDSGAAIAARRTSG